MTETHFSIKLVGMKQIRIATGIAVMVLSAALTGCASTEKIAPAPGPSPQTENPPVSEQETPHAEIPVPADDEFARSTADVDITKETFEEDKHDILEIIKNLDKVMSDGNYTEWRNYLDKESIDYWSQSANLQKASQRLPVKGLKLSNLSDYFKYVFIPSRKGRRIDEIRYETPTRIKVVQVKDDTDTVYYNFYRIGDSWKIHLPQITD